MSPRLARWIAWSLVAAFILLAGAGLILQGLTRAPFGAAWLPVAVILVTLVALWIVTGTLIISRHPRHPVGWLLCAGLFWPALDMFAAGYAAYDAYVYAGSLPGAALALVWLKLADLAPLGLVAFTLIVLLFPDGKLPSPGWRKVAWTTVGTLCIFLPLQAAEPRAVSFGFVPFGPNPLAVNPQLWVYLQPLMWTAFYILVLCFGAAAVSLLVRLRQSHGDVRQQVKWLVPPVGLYAVFLLLFMTGLSAVNNTIVAISIAVGQLAAAGIVIAIAIAIFRYRLYDIDLILNRTLVYGALTVCVVALYALIVGALGVLIQAQGNLVITLLATGLVAMLFQPLRERLQRAVNRLTYGSRDEPVAVFARLGALLQATASPQQMLPGMVRTIAETLRLPYAAVELEQAGERQVVAAHGRPGGEVARFPLVYQQETIGSLVAAPRTGSAEFGPADRDLLENIASQASAVAHAVQLTQALQRSRARLVSAREEERRRLRRDLHDELGPQLASQTLLIQAVERRLSQDPASAARLLGELQTQSQKAVTDIRRIVYDLRPPALDELGLLGALAEALAPFQRSGARISLDGPEDLPALPAAVEVAAFRIVQEAVTNVLRHARAGHCRVKIECGRARLRLAIEDDGVGLPVQRPFGVGLRSMRERAAELGGEFLIQPRPEGGTRVSAWLPVAEAGS
jgi:signal transduction histidine kinase